MSKIGPKVSVIITTYNSMAYLPKTLDSVLGQTFTDFEVLIVDDGSSDNITEWIKELKDVRIKTIFQSNQGVSVARNNGITNAQGEYIAFLDADDLWQPTKLEKQVLCLDKHLEVGLVHTWVSLINEQSQPTGRNFISNIEGNIWQQIIEKNMIACCSVMVRRTCFETVGGFDSSLRSAEDWDMWIRIADCYEVAVIKEILAYYRLLANSKSKNCLLVEQSLKTIIEKNFQSASNELLLLKNRSYAYAYFNLAWKALQNVEADYHKAISFRISALTYYPQFLFSQENLRLTIAIASMKWLGAKKYTQLLLLFYSWRRCLSKLFSK
jgi:glycosyltransferase involved in cell wall biosynthesis